MLDWPSPRFRVLGQVAWDTNGRVSIHARMSLARHATERSPSWMGSGNCESLIFRYTVVRLRPVSLKHLRKPDEALACKCHRSFFSSVVPVCLWILKWLRVFIN